MNERTKRLLSTIKEAGLSIEEIEDVVDDLLAYQDARLSEEAGAGENPYAEIERENVLAIV